MDFETYRGKVYVFFLVFASLRLCVNSREILSRAEADEFVEGMRRWMDAPIDEIDKGIPYHSTMPDDMLLSLDSVKSLNLLAPEEDLEAQAERVKQEIIAHGRFFRRVTEEIGKKSCDTTHKVPMPIVMTDFLRDDEGKIREPFDYWRDCVEVFLLKCLKGQSNSQIADQYEFRSSRSKSKRARMDLVAKMLFEAKYLMNSAVSNQFPPPISRGAKQHTVIN